MKAASKVLLGLAVVVVAVVLATAQAQEQKKEEKTKAVTLKGTILCTKCELGETKACGNAIRIHRRRR